MKLRCAQIIMFSHFILLSLSVGAMDSGGIKDPDYFFYDYEKRDSDVVDYQMYKLPNVDIWKFRGPKPDLQDGNYFTVLGAAAAMGVLVDKPFPDLVADEIGMKALNFGLGGASATAYADDDVIIDHINKGKFLIVQVMGAKMEANSAFTLTKQLGYVRKTDTKEISTVEEAWKDIVKTEPWNFFSYLGESKDTWVEGYQSLFEKVDVPVILLWFSPREAGFFSSIKPPTFIDKSTLQRVSDLCGTTELCDAYVEITSDRNLEFEFVNRFNGGPAVIDFRKIGTGGTDTQLTRNVNAPYASPEMHEDAVAPLIKAIKNLNLQ